MVYDPTGTLYVGAAGTPTAQFSTRAYGGAFDTPFASPFDNEEEVPSFAFDAAGNGTFVWVEGSNAVAVEKPAGAAFGNSQTLGPADTGSSPQLSVSPSGEALAAWSSGEHPVLAERAEGAASFGAAQTLPGDPTDGGVFGLAVVVPVLDSDGGGIILYTTDASDDYSVAYRAPGGAFGTPSALLSNVASVVEESNPAGDTVLVYTSDTSPDATIYARYRPHDGTFGAQETVASNVVMPDNLYGGVLPDGRVIVAYASTANEVGCSSADTIDERTAGTGGSWSTSTVLAGAPLSLSVSRTQDRYVLAYNTCTTGLLAGFGSFEGFQPGTVLPGQAGTEENDINDTAIDANGNATVIWEVTGGSSDLLAATYEGFGAPTTTTPTTTTPTTTTPTTTTPTTTTTTTTPTGGKPPPTSGLPVFTIQPEVTYSNGTYLHGIPIDGVECVPACTATVNGEILTFNSGPTDSARDASAHGKRYRLKVYRIRLAARRRTTLHVPISSRTRRALLAALHHHDSAEVVLTIGTSISRKKHTLTIHLKL